LERATELIDPALHVEPGTSKILRCFQIALLCVQENRADRPTMPDVLMMLKCDCLTLPVPRRPEDQWDQGVYQQMTGIRQAIHAIQAQGGRVKN